MVDQFKDDITDEQFEAMIKA
jgi:hypothetical protein